jgi:hypothetical protein
MAAIYNAPTKILPRVRSGGVLRTIGGNLVAYTQRPAVNLALLLLAGALLAGMGFVLGSARRESPAPASPTPIAEPAAVRTAPVRAAIPLPTASVPVAAIAVSSLPIAPPKEPLTAHTSPAGSTAAHAPSADFPLLPDRPPAATEKGFVPPVRNPGF